MLKRIFILAAIITGIALVFIVINSCEDLSFRDQLEDSVKKWYEQAELTAGDEAETDSKYGTAVAIDGDFAVVGAFNKTVGAFNAAGAVYIYKRNGRSWDLFQTLTGTTDYDYFGTAVDISGNFLIIGATGADEAAYIYENTGTEFVFRKKLSVGDYTSYGSAVAIDGDWAAVGARDTDWGGATANPEGAVYLYSKSSEWQQQQKLKPEYQGESDWFGDKIDISGDILIVGARYNDSTGNNAGAVYVYQRNNDTNIWGVGFSNYENQMITISNAQPLDTFGSSLAIFQDLLIVGAEGNDGFVTVFKKEGTSWLSSGRLVNQNITADDNLGYAVAVSDQFAVVGTRYSAGISSKEGAIYIFKLEKDQWNFFSKHTANDASAESLFGSSLAISGDYIIAGAPGHTVNDVDKAGSVYIFYRE